MAIDTNKKLFSMMSLATGMPLVHPDGAPFDSIDLFTLLELYGETLSAAVVPPVPDARIISILSEDRTISILSDDRTISILA